MTDLHTTKWIRSTAYKCETLVATTDIKAYSGPKPVCIRPCSSTSMLCSTSRCLRPAHNTSTKKRILFPREGLVLVRLLLVWVKRDPEYTHGEFRFRFICLFSSCLFSIFWTLSSTSLPTMHPSLMPRIFHIFTSQVSFCFTDPPKFRSVFRVDMAILRLSFPIHVSTYIHYCCSLYSLCCS